MGLFRLAIVAAVGISLLPSESEQQEKLYARAAEAAHWTMTFCERNAGTCTQAAALWDQFVKKAEFGAKLAYDALTDKKTPSNIETGAVKPAPQSKTSAHTLKRTDFVPTWHGAISVQPPSK